MSLTYGRRKGGNSSRRKSIRFSSLTCPNIRTQATVCHSLTSIGCPFATS
jgi:hypothetical protein